MALSSRDETDLLLPLLSRAAEERPFSVFLERLRRRADATYVSIIIRLGDGRETVHLHVGPDIPARARELRLDEMNLSDRVQYDRLRPGRVYSGDEFDDHDPMLKARRARDMRKLGLADERAMRLLHEDAVSAWLVLASARPCSATDSALLSALFPYIAAAVRTFIVEQTRALASVLDADGLQRAGSGWIVFDKAARVLAMAPSTAALLTDALGHAPGARLRELGPTTERTLTEAAAAFAQTPDAPERTLLLLTEPRVEAILTPMRKAIGTHLDVPAMVAHCRQGRAPAQGRAEHLARLHALPRREAELAILLADGLSLAEASEAMRLTIETTRNYSKRLFAKLGVRGQAELVRAVYESCAVLA